MRDDHGAYKFSLYVCAFYMFAETIHVSALNVFPVNYYAALDDQKSTKIITVNHKMANS